MIYIGADHRGFELKEHITKYLLSQGVPCKDLGAHEYNKDDDYPPIAQSVAQALTQEEDVGILICGAGHGVAVVASKVKGVRASVVDTVESARMGRNDDHLNVLCLGAQFLDADRALQIVDAFVTTPYSNEARHLRRLAQITAMERSDG